MSEFLRVSQMAVSIIYSKCTSKKLARKDTRDKSRKLQFRGKCSLISYIWEIQNPDEYINRTGSVLTDLQCREPDDIRCVTEQN